MFARYKGDLDTLVNGAKALKDLKEDADLTQKQVADRLDISRSYVSRIEKKALLKLKKCMM